MQKLGLRLKADCDVRSLKKNKEIRKSKENKWVMIVKDQKSLDWLRLGNRRTI